MTSLSVHFRNALLCSNVKQIKAVSILASATHMKTFLGCQKKGTVIICKKYSGQDTVAIIANVAHGKRHWYRNRVHAKSRNFARYNVFVRHFAVHFNFAVHFEVHSAMYFAVHIAMYSARYNVCVRAFHKNRTFRSALHSACRSVLRRTFHNTFSSVLSQNTSQCCVVFYRWDLWVIALISNVLSQYYGNRSHRDSSVFPTMCRTKANLSPYTVTKKIYRWVTKKRPLWFSIENQIKVDLLSFSTECRA